MPFCSPGPSNLHDEQLHHDPVVLEQIYLPGILHVSPRTQDVATQTQWPELLKCIGNRRLQHVQIGLVCGENHGNSLRFKFLLPRAWSKQLILKSHRVFEASRCLIRSNQHGNVPNTDGDFLGLWLVYDDLSDVIIMQITMIQRNTGTVGTEEHRNSRHRGTQEQ